MEETTKVLTADAITSKLVANTRDRINVFAGQGASVPLTPPMQAVFDTMLRQEYEKDFIIQTAGERLYFIPKRLG